MGRGRCRLSPRCLSVACVDCRDGISTGLVWESDASWVSYPHYDSRHSTDDDWITSYHIRAGVGARPFCVGSMLRVTAVCWSVASCRHTYTLTSASVWCQDVVLSMSRDCWSPITRTHPSSSVQVTYEGFNGCTLVVCSWGFPSSRTQHAAQSYGEGGYEAGVCRCVRC